MLVFLDANVLFSAALGGGSFDLLFDLAAAGKLRLCTSPYCVAEAEGNLLRKRPDGEARFRERLLAVAMVPDAAEPPAWGALSAKAAPVLSAAIGAGADVLVTGDVKHFGELMRESDRRPRVRTLRRFLLEGP